MSSARAESPSLDFVSSFSLDGEKDDYFNTPLLASTPETSSVRNDPDKIQRRRHTWLFPITTATLFSSNFITVFHLILSYTSPHCSPTNSSDPPSGIPNILSHLPFTTTPKLFNATLHDPSNPYRLHSSPIADRAWADLISDAGVLLVQKGEETAAGIEPDRHVHWDEPERGLVRYPVVVEAVHQLHCLIVLRKHLWYNVEWTREQYSEEEKMTDGVTRELHIDHCVDLLCQRLMCTADTRLLPLVWIGREGQSVADFVRWHSCREHDALRSLVREHTVLGHKAGEILPKPGELSLDGYE